MANDFPLKKVDKNILQKNMETIVESLNELVNREISSIKSDMQRILNVVQESPMDQDTRRE